MPPGNEDRAINQETEINHCIEDRLTDFCKLYGKVTSEIHDSNTEVYPLLVTRGRIDPNEFFEGIRKRTEIDINDYFHHNPFLSLIQRKLWEQMIYCASMLNIEVALNVIGHNQREIKEIFNDTVDKCVNLIRFGSSFMDRSKLIDTIFGPINAYLIDSRPSKQAQTLDEFMEELHSEQPGSSSAFDRWFKSEEF